MRKLTQLALSRGNLSHSGGGGDRSILRVRLVLSILLPNARAKPV